jgi:hypothetical protein
MTKIALGASDRNAWQVSDEEGDLVRRASPPLVAEIVAESAALADASVVRT